MQYALTPETIGAILQGFGATPKNDGDAPALPAYLWPEGTVTMERDGPTTRVHAWGSEQFVECVHTALEAHVFLSSLGASAPAAHVA